MLQSRIRIPLQGERGGQSVANLLAVGRGAVCPAKVFESTVKLARVERGYPQVVIVGGALRRGGRFRHLLFAQAQVHAGALGDFCRRLRHDFFEDFTGLGVLLFQEETCGGFEAFYGRCVARVATKFSGCACRRP